MGQRARENAAVTSAGKTAGKQAKTRTRPFLTPYGQAVFERFKAFSRRLEKQTIEE